MSKIGVLLPVYLKDSIPYLSQSVESILGQTLQDFHVYIGVDGPVGNELNDCLLHLEQDSRISVNRGLACVLNDLIAICKKTGYEYYARMDADDISQSDRFERQISFLDNNPDVDVVGGAIDEIDDTGTLRGKHVVYPLSHDECRRFFRYRDPLAHPAVMFRARFFEKVPSGYREEYRKNQDTMLWFDGFMNGCVFANLSETVLRFRVNDDFYSRRNGLKRARQMLRDRITINKTLGYDISANLFAMAMFGMTISPAWMKKFLYTIRLFYSI